MKAELGSWTKLFLLLQPWTWDFTSCSLSLSQLSSALLRVQVEPLTEYLKGEGLCQAYPGLDPDPEGDCAGAVEMFMPSALAVVFARLDEEDFREEICNDLFELKLV